MKKKMVRMILGLGIATSLFVTQAGSMCIVEASEQDIVDFVSVMDDEGGTCSENETELSGEVEEENSESSEDSLNSEANEEDAVEIEFEDSDNESDSGSDSELEIEIEENNEIQSTDKQTEENSEISVFSSGEESRAVKKYIAQGKNEDLSWTIDDKGCFVLEGTGTTDEDYALDWLDYTDEIKSAVVNISGVTSTKGMFLDCSNLETIDLKKSDFSQVTDMSEMFAGCENICKIDLSKSRTSQVTSMANMFEGCEKLQSLNLTGFNTSKVTNMSGMFYECKSLKNLNLTGFNTSKVTNMSNMFGDCFELKTIGLGTFNTSKVTNMSKMFDNCRKLQDLDLSKFRLTCCKKADYMFSGCGNLTSIRTIPELKMTIKIPDAIYVKGKSNLYTGLVDWIDSAGHKYKNMPQKKKNSITLLRKKKGSYCIVTFNSNGGKVSEKTRAVSLGSAVGKLPSVSREGCKFTGWYTAKTGGKKLNSKTKINKKMTIYARWSPKISIKKVDIKIKSCTYNGKRQEPALTVKTGKKTLKENKDYTVKYSNNIDAGSGAVAQITGKGAYWGSVSKKFKINCWDISKNSYIKLTKDLYTWDGTEKKPQFAVYIGKTAPNSSLATLQDKKDYTYKYKNNKEPGTATLVITGKGNYSGTKTINYKINKQEQPAEIGLVTLKKTYEDIKKSYAIPVSNKKESAKMTCVSSDKKVADIDKNNNIVLKGTGKATISVKFDETKHYRGFEQKISVIVLKKQDIQTQIKDGQEIEYTENPVSLGAEAKGKLTFSSSDTRIAEVDENGNINLKNAKKLGKVTITITAAETEDYVGVTKKITICTTKGAPIINYNPNIRRNITEGGFKLNVTSNVPFSYSSVDESLVKVDENGNVEFGEWTGGNEVKTVKIKILSEETDFYKADSREISLDIAHNPYEKWQDVDEDGRNEVRCTYFAWQQVFLNSGEALPGWRNGGEWLNNAQADGYQTGNVPRAGAIAVWSDGKYGHVAYVASVEGNNTFTVNEGGRTDLDGEPDYGVKYGYTITNVVGGLRPGSKNSQTLLGFIYID